MPKILAALLALSLLFGLRQVLYLADIEANATETVQPQIRAIGDLHGATLAARKPQIAWFTNAHWKPLEAGNTWQKCYDQQVDYILLGPVEFSMRPELLNDAQRLKFQPLYKIARFEPDFILLARNSPPFYLP